MLRFQLVPAVAMLVLAASCAGEPAAIPLHDVPAAFDTPADPRGSMPTPAWYRGFSSPELSALIERASNTNLDIAAARSRVMQADARARQAGAALLPSLDGVGNANYLTGHSSQGTGHEVDWSAVLSANYEIDFWGKNRSARDSATHLAGASRADRDTVTLTIQAGVADQYLSILALRDRLTIARSNQETAQQLLDVINARFAAGAATPGELATQRSVYDVAQITRVGLEQMHSDAQTALALLLGQEPEKFAVAGQPLDSLTEPVVAAGLPSELLTRRPDIFRAEENLRASHADLSVARAALFPSLSLTGSAGVQDPALQAAVLTIGGAGPTLSIGANLLQPIFNRGRLRAQRDEVIAKDQELLTAYRAAILAALVDVENALSAIRHLEDASSFQLDNVAQTTKAYEGARLRYQAGAGDYLLVLEAQRSLFSARDQFVQYKLGRLQALVTLAKALGGGWDSRSGSDASAANLHRTANP